MHLARIGVADLFRPLDGANRHQARRGEMRDPGNVVRVAAVGDLHCTKVSQGQFQALFAAAAGQADIMVLCGDLTDYGLPEEAEVLVKEMAGGAKLPTIAVLGNHDFESRREEEVRRVLVEAGILVLDGDAVEVRGIGFAGAKGFAGGFGRGTLGAWGEPAVKLFVQEAVNEAMKLESALARLRTGSRIAVLHYAPIRATVENEPVEIFPFLGCSRLEDPLNRYPVTAVVHGHAHNGCPEGVTSGGTPVYNVSLPLLRKIAPDQPHFRILEIPVASTSVPEPSPPSSRGR
jgi:Icc-related predicted phosphoesterase